MRTLVVGDVHGCASELARLHAAVQPERVVLVGDLYTKGPDPAGVWRLMCAWSAEAVLGNHDARLLAVLAGRRHDDPEAARCIAALDAEGRGWREALEALPLWREVHGWLVVHGGVHPELGPEGTSRAQAITMRRWPEADASAPRWHTQYRRAQPVVFGHDAKGGLVWHEREGQPHVVGLDTGCVYGGVLSGLILPDAVLVQVPAEAAWCPIGQRGET